MKKELANQISELLNNENQLTIKYTAEMILRNSENYVYILDETNRIIAVGELSKVQWYQCEIKHISVKKENRKKGLGIEIVNLAELQAKNHNCRILQCTIRSNNIPSIKMFTKLGYIKSCNFYNTTSNNDVSVFHKAISTKINKL